jgi:hypothetical protein
MSVWLRSASLRVVQDEVPFRGAFFLGDGFHMALPWAEGEVPLAGRQIANRPENSSIWYQTTAGVRESRVSKYGEAFRFKRVPMKRVE